MDCRLGTKADQYPYSGGLGWQKQPLQAGSEALSQLSININTPDRRLDIVQRVNKSRLQMDCRRFWVIILAVILLMGMAVGIFLFTFQKIEAREVLAPRRLVESDLVFEAVAEGIRPGGCVIIDPELLRLHPDHHILMPLKTSDYHVEIVNSIANIVLTQEYFNPTDKSLEVEYNFPINPKACVYKFVAEFGKTRIEGVVKEKEQAKKEYQQAVSEGKKAAYAAINSNSKDILNLKVGNIPPKGTVRVELVYLQELDVISSTFYQFHMVGTITPRYMNHIPGEVIKAGLRNEQAKAKGDFYWNFRISLQTSRKVVFVKSSSHDIIQLFQNGDKTESEFAMAKLSVPNKDFYFTFTTQNFQLPSYVFGKNDASSTVMVSFIPKFCHLGLEEAYGNVVKGRSFDVDIDGVRGEYIFVLDRSGSMYGSRIRKAKQSLILFIKSLPSDSYFNIFSFGSVWEKMFTNSVRYRNQEILSAVQKVNTFDADLGGTEIYYALNEVLRQKPIEGYAKQIFLLTDGAVSNTQGVIKLVAANTKYSRVHTIGIGNGASEALIVGCAEKGKGYHVFIPDNENPANKIIQLLTDSFSPVISNMKLTYDKTIVESIIPNPESLPYVLKGELVNFYITFKGQFNSTALFSFSYQDSLNKVLYQSSIEVEPNSTSYSFIDKMGHFKRIRLLEESQSAGSNLGELMLYGDVVDKKAKIISQSVKYQILSVYTAFLCVEKVLINGRYQQVKGTDKVKVVIQNPLPLGYEAESQSTYPVVNMNTGTINNFGSTGNGSTPPSIAPPSYSPLNYQPISPFSGLNSTMSSPSSSSPSYGYSSYGTSSYPSNGIASGSSGSSGSSPNFYRPLATLVPISSPLGPSSPPSPPSPPSSPSPSSNYQSKSAASNQSPPSTLISEVVLSQSADGSWSDLDLLQKLLGKEVVAKISLQARLTPVITYLIAKWIQKNHPESGYSLVVKKGLNFVQKQASNYQKFDELYGQYVK